jgi:hypothetical protein
MSLDAFISKHTVDVVIPVACAVVAILAGLLGVWWGNRHSRKLARESGALKQRNLGLFIGNHEIHKREIWCYCFPEHDANKTCVMMDLQIVNKGGLTCDGVVVTINTAKDLLSSYSPKKGHLLHKVYPSVLEGDIKRAVADTDDLHRHFSYTLPPIHPKSGAVLSEWLFLKQTVDIPESTGVKTKDNKKVEFQWRMSLSWPMTLSVIATDCEPTIAKLEIFGVRADSIPDALQQLRRVAGQTQARQSPLTDLKKSPAEHHIRFFRLKQSQRENIDGKLVVVFKVAEMKATILHEHLVSLFMKPKVELLDIKPGKQRNERTR